VARYDRYGFEAAAISAMAVMSGSAAPSQGVVRTAELRFAHPYAVVAVAADSTGFPTNPWLGLPVFSAWVANVDEPDPDLPDTDLPDADGPGTAP
jgi:hypothetical protein